MPAPAPAPHQTYTPADADATELVSDSEVTEMGPANAFALVIGRGTDTDVQLDEPSVSRRHAVLTYDGQTLTVEDLGSSNGTWVNNQRISTPIEIDDGQIVRLGRRDYVVELDPSAGALVHDPVGNPSSPANPHAGSASAAPAGRNRPIPPPPIAPRPPSDARPIQPAAGTVEKRGWSPVTIVIGACVLGVLLLLFVIALVANAGGDSGTTDFHDNEVLAASVRETISSKLSRAGSSVRVVAVTCIDVNDSTKKCLAEFSDATNEALNVTVSADGTKWISEAA